jgi:hypothetical protein
MRLLFAFALLLAVLVPAWADDIADAKAAFETLQEYQQSDDPRMLDLFAKDVSVTMLVSDGKDVRPTYLPRADFFASLKRELLQKKGNKDVYENVKFVQEGADVRLTTTMLDASTGKRGPVTLLYARDKEGVLRIKEMKVTVHSPRQLPGLF